MGLRIASDRGPPCVRDRVVPGIASHQRWGCARRGMDPRPRRINDSVAPGATSDQRPRPINDGVAPSAASDPRPPRISYRARRTIASDPGPRSICDHAGAWIAPGENRRASAAGLQLNHPELDGLTNVGVESASAAREPISRRVEPPSPAPAPQACALAPQPIPDAPGIRPSGHTHPLG